MGQYSVNGSQLGVARPTTVPERIIAFLRLQHPVKTAAQVAAHTGTGEATVKKWLERSSVPNGVAFLRLIGAYGPEFLVALMDEPPAWLVAEARAKEQARIHASIAALQAKLER